MSPQKKNRNGKETAVRGELCETAWNKYDDIEGLTIETTDGVEFAIDPEGQFEELFDFVGSILEVTGHVYTVQDKRMIVVSRFEKARRRPMEDDFEYPDDFYYND